MKKTQKKPQRDLRQFHEGPIKIIIPPLLPEKVCPPNEQKLSDMLRNSQEKAQLSPKNPLKPQENPKLSSYLDRLDCFKGDKGEFDFELWEKCHMLHFLDKCIKRHIGKNMIQEVIEQCYGNECNDCGKIGKCRSQ